jgi:DNA-binding transcriptional MocR family regulator
VTATLGATEVRGHLGDWHRGQHVLYDGLADALEELIRGGVLPPDTRLPAERRLAEVLHLSRSTVKAAYEALQDRGLVATRHGSGSVILAEASPLTGPREAHVLASFEPNSIYQGILRLDPEALDLRGAYWAEHDVVTAEVVAAAHEQLAKLPRADGYHPLGVDRAREAIAEHLTATGLPTGADQVLVTTGAQQAISLVADLLLAQGDTVALEELSFPGAMNYMTSRQARLLPVPFTPAGVDIQALDRLVRATRPRLTYLMTSVHNPTGAVLPGPARFRLAELAAGWDTVIVDDRTLADTQTVGTPATPLATLVDEHGRADRMLTVGSMSKIAWGGLRVGWVRGTAATIERVARIKTLSDFGTAVLDQLIAVELLADPELVPRRRAELRERHDAFRAALGHHVPDWELSRPQGGMCLWARLPGADSHEFARVAARHGVGVAPGTVASPTRSTADHLRLPFGQPVGVLEEAAARLGAAWDELRSRTRPHYDPACVVV